MVLGFASSALDCFSSTTPVGGFQISLVSMPPDLLLCTAVTTVGSGNMIYLPFTLLENKEGSNGVSPLSNLVSKFNRPPPHTHGWLHLYL